MVLRVNNIAPFRLNIKGKDISCSNTVKLGEIINHNKFKFKKHIENLCKKASFEFHALRRIRAQLTDEKANLLANAFIDSQFRYAPLIWKFTGKTLINAVCKIHRRTLQMFCNERNKLYEELVLLDNKVLIYQKLLQLLAFEVFKSLMHLNLKVMRFYFNINPTQYDLRNGNKIFLSPIRST